MTSRDFAYWLQGFIEIQAHGPASLYLTEDQVKVIKNHLALVFVHDIDPANVAASGVPAIAAQSIHDTGKPDSQIGGTDAHGNIARC